MGSGNPIKAVGKIFKSVVKSPIGKVAVAAGIAYFTMGMGSTLLGAVGASPTFLSSTLGTVLSGAVSGTIAGGLTSAVTGQDIGKGLMFGAAGGAIAGGVTAYMNSASAAANAPDWVNPDLVPGNVSNAAQSVGVMDNAALASNTGFSSSGLAPDVPGVSDIATSGATEAGARGMLTNQAIPISERVVTPLSETVSPAGSAIEVGSRTVTPAMTPAPNVTSGLPNAGTAAPTSTAANAAQSVWTVAKENPIITGSVIAGGGQAIGGAFGGSAAAEGSVEAARIKAEAEAAAERDKAGRIAASHDPRGMLTNLNVTVDPTQRPKPEDRFNPASYSHPGSWQFDPAVGRIVFVKHQAA